MAASPVISSKNFVTRDLLKLPKDIVIVLEDGRVEANKDLLSVRSDFFDRSFNNPKFTESQSKSITMKGCTEAAMRAIVDYIYTGDMDLRNHSLATLLRIMNFSREILIEDYLFNRIEAFLRDLLTVNSSESIAKFLRRIAFSSSISGASTATDLMKCPVLVEGFRLDNLRESVFRFTSATILMVLNYIEKKQKVAAVVNDKTSLMGERMMSEFYELPHRIVKDLLLFDHGAHNLNFFKQRGYTKTKFTLFAAWFSVNEDNCTVEEKQEVLGGFNYMDLTGEELVKVVGRSGMFSREEVEEMVIERLKQYEERQ